MPVKSGPSTEGIKLHCPQSIRFRCRGTTEKVTHGSRQENVSKAKAQSKKLHSPDQAGKTPKLLGSSQGQLLVIQFESYTGRAAGVGLTSEKSLHAQTQVEKGSLCQSSHLKTQECLRDGSSLQPKPRLAHRYESCHS